MFLTPGEEGLPQNATFLTQYLLSFTLLPFGGR